MINKNSSVPMYEQIVQILKKEILEHKYLNNLLIHWDG